MASVDILSHCATILPVVDMEKSLHFYNHLLGFEITFKWQDPVEYAVLKRASIQLHLTLGSEEEPPQPRPVLYIFTHDIDALYNDLLLKNVKIHSPSEKQDYGMRDFDIVDPDGHRITFGQDATDAI